MGSLKIASLWCSLALMDLRLKLFPHRWNESLLRADSPRRKPSTDAGPSLQDADALKAAKALAGLVSRAARHPFVFNMSCLRQALVLRATLKTLGIDAVLVYGAAKSDAGLAAHAWVELGGECLIGGPVDSFRRFGAPNVS